VFCAASIICAVIWRPFNQLQKFKAMVQYSASSSFCRFTVCSVLRASDELDFVVVLPRVVQCFKSKKDNNKKEMMMMSYIGNRGTTHIN
jgi:hypothetical protein